MKWNIYTIFYNRIYNLIYIHICTYVCFKYLCDLQVTIVDTLRASQCIQFLVYIYIYIYMTFIIHIYTHIHIKIHNYKNSSYIYHI
jgi:hypothetical protein